MTAWPEEPHIWVPNEPCDGQAITIDLPHGPVSAQATGRARSQIKAEVAKLTRQVPWLFTGDVEVLIEWTLDEKTRYQSDRALDLDNTLKPILDGLSGPDGCLIDDTQVQHVSAHWIDWTRTDRQHLKITIQPLAPDECTDKSLVMVEVRPRMCLPLPTGFEPEGLWVALEMIETMFDTADALIAEGAPPEIARRVLPSQRTFHRNKLRDFEVLTPDEYRDRFCRRPSSGPEAG